MSRCGAWGLLPPRGGSGVLETRAAHPCPPHPKSQAAPTGELGPRDFRQETSQHFPPGGWVGGWLGGWVGCKPRGMDGCGAALPCCACFSAAPSALVGARAGALSPHAASSAPTHSPLSLPQAPRRPPFGGRTTRPECSSASARGLESTTGGRRGRGRGPSTSDAGARWRHVEADT